MSTNANKIIGTYVIGVLSVSTPITSTSIPVRFVSNEPAIICIDARMDNKIDYKSIIESYNYLDTEAMGIEKPNANSIKTAIDIIIVFEDKGMNISNLTPSPDGGIMIEFESENAYRVIEIYNDGEIIYVKNDNEEMASKKISLENIDNLILTEFNEHINV